MVYFQLAVYFLVIIWIQDGVAQFEPISISSFPTTVLPREPYAIICQTRYYANFWFKRNNELTIKVSYQECNIPQSKATDYICISTKVGQYYVVKLRVLGGENSLQTVQWSCVYSSDNRMKSRILNMTVRNPDLPTTTQQKPSSTNPTQSPRQTSKTPSPTQSSRQTTPVRAPLTTTSPSTSSSSKDPQTADKSPPSRTPPDQPPVSSTNNIDKLTKYFTTNLIATCVIGVLVLINITIVLMFLYNKRKQDPTKQGSSGPLALEPRGIPGDYDNLDRTMDDGEDNHTYDTAQAQVVQESSNLGSNGDEIPS